MNQAAAKQDKGGFQLPKPTLAQVRGAARRSQATFPPSPPQWAHSQRRCPPGSSQVIIAVSFTTITTIMFSTVYLVYNAGAIHFNDR